MQRSSPLTWSLLLFSLGLLATSLSMQRQRTLNDLATQAQFSRVASDQANQIVERIYRFQYGLRGIQGAILGTDARHLSQSTFRAFHNEQDVSLEFNGARGFGYMQQQGAGEISVPFFEPLDEMPLSAGQALLRSPQSVATAAMAWSRQAPTLSAPLSQAAPSANAPVGHRSSTSLENLLLVMAPAHPRSAGDATPKNSDAAYEARGWVYVLLDVNAALVDLTPRAQDYQLTITDVTSQPSDGQVFNSIPPVHASPTVRWQSKREVLGRRWLIEARADASFGEGLNLMLPSSVGWIGLGFSTLAAASFFALWSNRQRRLELRRQEAQLAALVRNSSDAIVSQTPDGHIVSWNRAAEQIFGIPATAMIGQHWHTLLLNPDAQSEDKRLLADVIAGHTPPPLDTVLRAADGTPIDVSMSVVALFDHDGKVEHISRTIRDNRERKAAEERLRESAQLLAQQVQTRTAELAESEHKLAEVSRQSEALLNTIQLHTIYSVADYQGTIIDVNEAFCDISGYSRDELIGQNHRIVNSGVHPQAFWAEMWRTVSQGQPWHHEICNRAKDGSLYWLDSIIAPFRGADGQVDRYISLHTDVTERRQSEERLRASSEGFLERAGQMAGVGGWELDLATGEMWLTRQTRAIFGLDEDRHLTLEESLRFFQFPARELLRQAIQNAQQTRQGWDLELPFVNAKGDKLWVRTVGGVDRVAVVDDEARRLVGALQDVTSQHLTEEALLAAKRTAEEANSAKTEFLANMSHEIRTPLNAIMGMTHLLGESLEDTEQRAWISKIQAANKSLMTVLNDVLDLSKIEAGELTLEGSNFSLRKLLQEMESLFAPQAIHKSLAFSISLPPDLPESVHGDHFRVRQVLLNLLSNAFKFTLQGSVSLSLRVTDKVDNKVQLRFLVADTGLGMSEDTLARLFEPFTQADASTTRRFGGSGLGLSIVRRLVTLMGGEVGVSSEPGKGSLFWFTLPLTLATPSSPALIGPDHLRVAVIGTHADEMAQLSEMGEQMGWLVQRVSMDHDDMARASLDLQGPQRPDLIVLEYALLHSLWWRALVHADQAQAPLPVPVLVYRNAPQAQAALPQTPEGADGEVLHPWSCTSLYNAAQFAMARHHTPSDRLYACSKPEAIPARWLDGLHLLVVDDSDINLEVAQRLLRSEGAQVDTAANGEQALRCIESRQHDYDAVLMDVQMPVMDGKEATRQIRQDMGLIHMPIIALTAGALMTERQRAMDAGMNDFATKPLDPHGLIRVIRRHVEQTRGHAIALVEHTQAPQRRVAPQNETPSNWPAIEGIDMHAVMAEFASDAPFYRGLLKRLLMEYGAPRVDWHAPLADAAAAETMRARLHKLHGSAAVLHAPRLASLAKECEVGLQTPAEAEPDNLAPRLAAIGHEIDRIAQSAGLWLSAPDEAPVDSPPPLLEPRALKQWVAALQAQDLQAITRFQTIQSALHDVMPTEGFAALQEAIEGLDFAQALTVLGRYKLLDETAEQV